MFVLAVNVKEVAAVEMIEVSFKNVLNFSQSSPHWKWLNLITLIHHAWLTIGVLI